jgi:hypothetical protein
LLPQAICLRVTPRIQVGKHPPVTAGNSLHPLKSRNSLFYFLIREGNLPITNPCANFKQFKDPRMKANRRPAAYRQEETDRIFAECDEFEKAIFATLLLTGLR